MKISGKTQGEAAMRNVRLQSLPSSQYVALLNERIISRSARSPLSPVQFEVRGDGRSAHTSLRVSRVDEALVRQAMTEMQDGGLFCHPPIRGIVHAGDA
ncbi:hypothetical protein [Achromobacter xylosoxidans]|uniref:hypothetical protein n=1 Tax=Alcaligenes xylosoxydans xylosoxydans TaxID=85698 RepID=UPI001EEB02EC|nr:hypothetical protein [Achromobacter xylosoxidans]